MSSQLRGKRVLCVCAGGRVRSVAMRYVLTEQYGADAIACGVEKNSPATITALCRWADIILVAEPGMVAKLPRSDSGRARSVNLGPDVWGSESHPDLRAKAASVIERIVEGI